MQIWIAISIGLISQEEVSVSYTPPEPPPAPTFDLFWRDGEGITWRADTIIDYRVIS